MSSKKRKKTRKTCKAAHCTGKPIRGSYCNIHYRKHRRYEGMNVKGET